MQPTKISIWLVLFLLVGLTVGCDLAGEAAEEREATVDALQELVVLTATAVAADEVTSDELIATAEAAATEAVATISAAATEEAIAVTATAAAAEATRAAQPAPPAPTGASPFALSGEAETAVFEELPLYNVDPTQGGPALGHPPVNLALDDGEAVAITTEFPTLVVADFVLAADVTPDVQTGSAACGLVLRAGTEADAFRYVVLPGPPGSGQVLLQTWQGDIPLAEETIAFDAAALDPAFTEANQATNRLAVVAEGPTLTIYSNGTRLGEATPATAVAQGIVAFLIATESPEDTEATCRFDNAWLWLLSPAE
jgi:hypothetical protein